MFTIYFWRRLHAVGKIRGNLDAHQRHIDAGYCIDRYLIEKE